MPTPGAGESEQAFISRCIAQRQHEHPSEDTSQSAAICHTVFRKRLEDPPNPDETEQTHVGLIKTIDTAQRLVFGWAYVARDDAGTLVKRAPRTEDGLIIDHQGDFAEPEEIEQAAYQYMEKYRGSSEQHERFHVSTIVESVAFTKAKYDAMGLPPGPEGWWIGFRVNDDGVWNKIRSGGLTEFSIGGDALRDSSMHKATREYQRAKDGKFGSGGVGAGIVGAEHDARVKEIQDSASSPQTQFLAQNASPEQKAAFFKNPKVSSNQKLAVIAALPLAERRQALSAVMGVEI